MPIRRLAALAALLLLAGIAVGLRRALDPALTSGERELVGRWRFQIDGMPAGLYAEYELRPDRRCVLYNLDPQTGAMRAVGVVPPNSTWRRAGDTLFIRTPNQLVAPRWDVLGTRRDMVEALDLAPDGPERFRYALNMRHTRPTQPAPVTGTLVRVPDGD